MKLRDTLTLIIILIVFPRTLSADSDLIRNIVVAGNEMFTEKQIRRLMQTRIGTDYDEEMLNQDLDRIIAFYRRNGLRFARIDEEQLLIKKFSDGVYLRIPIDEGKIGKITVEGNTRTKDHVLLQELLFAVGSTYTEGDELESERILRRKPYLGEAEITATWDAETQLVRIRVEVIDLWTFIPALDLPAFNKNSSNLLIMLSDSNLFGSGDKGRIRYQLIREDGEATRRLLSSRYKMLRLFGSHWEFDGLYTQKREGNSWEVTLGRPQYSLQTRWSADFSISEAVDRLRWYEHGEKTDTFERSMQMHSGRLTRFFGDRHKQTQVALWVSSLRSNFSLIEKFGPSDVNFENRDIQMIGISLGRRRADFVRTRFLNRMGRVEDIEIGFGYGASIGYASPWYGSDRSQTNLNLLFSLSQAYNDQLFLNARTGLTARFAEQLEDSLLNARVKMIRKGWFHQTLAVRVSTVMGFDLGGRSQVILGGLNGLRGYATREFSGEKVLSLNVESRTIFGGRLFDKLESLIVLGSVIFADMGYIWNGEEFNLREPKRSVGFGLRFSLPRLTDSRVYRLDLAYPLDNPEGSSFVVTYGIGNVF